MKVRVDYTKLVKAISETPKFVNKANFCRDVMSKQQFNHYLTSGVVMPQKYIDAFREKYGFSDKQINSLFFCKKVVKNTNE